MHIAEGVVSTRVLTSGIVLSAVGTGIGLKTIKSEDVSRVALLSAAFFIASLIHVPVGIANVHLVLNGLLGIILGWKVFPSILVALFLQAILFQYGGITVLGVNTVVMGLPSVMVYYMFRKFIYNNRKLVFLFGFLAGGCAIFLSALLLYIALFFSSEAMHTPAKVIFLANLPLIFIEGIITGFAVVFLKKVKPEIFMPLKSEHEINPRETG